jgi:hypothetical protein
VRRVGERRRVDQTARSAWIASSCASRHPAPPGSTGPWSYGFYEVLGSDWAARLWAQNRVVFPDGVASDKRHFLVACHEDLVEVLADDVEVEVSQRRFEEVALEALRCHLGDHR